MEIGSKPFIIAEMSGNHSGDLAKAQELIAVAAKCGCDAIKIQTYEPEDLEDPDNNLIYEKSKIPRQWFHHLFQTAKKNHIPLFSSVFSVSAIDFLEQFNCPAYKIASPQSTRLNPNVYREITKKIKATNKIFIASSGRMDMEFIRQLKPDYTFYCVPGYPATINHSDIKFFRFHRCDGFSDHTNDVIAPLAMIAAGAKLIEKHFKLDEKCVDAAFSFNPEQMETLCGYAHR